VSIGKAIKEMEGGGKVPNVKVELGRYGNNGLKGAAWWRRGRWRNAMILALRYKTLNLFISEFRTSS
jgi:hypothetical protein